VAWTQKDIARYKYTTIASACMPGEPAQVASSARVPSPPRNARHFGVESAQCGHAFTGFTRDRRLQARLLPLGSSHSTGMSYLVNLALEGRAAVVVGGGEVAARKVQGLLAAKANVTVIAPHLCEAIVARADERRIPAHRRPYRTGDIAGAVVAIAATDDEGINARVAGDAAAMHVLVNVVDRPALGTFAVPATLRRGDLTLAVATGGRCPALAGVLLLDEFLTRRACGESSSWDTSS
jgi:hypothetical protein